MTTSSPAKSEQNKPTEAAQPKAENQQDQTNAKPVTEERGGPKGPEPTRFGDWEKNGRCFDF